jgi:hypothetical protein
LNIFVVRSTGLTGVSRDSIAWPWMSGVATLHAAPGAGKTLFAGAVLQKLRDAGHVDRLIVVMPNVAICRAVEGGTRGGFEFTWTPNPATAFSSLRTRPAR